MAGGRGRDTRDRVRVTDTRRRLSEALRWVEFTAFFVFVAWAGGAFSTRWSDEPWQGTLFWLGLLLVFPAMGVSYVWRTARLGVDVEADAVVVRNSEGPRRLPIADVDRVELAEVPYDRHTYVTLVLVDGTTLPVDGLVAVRTRRSAAWDRRRARAQTFADQLNDALTDRLRATPAG